MSVEQESLISVMIPVYNCARYLAEAIESVRDQAYRPLELIVVDDGSDDGSGAVAQRYAPFVSYVYQPRSGIGAARNRALELARGSLLAFLDADDVFTPGRLELQAAALQADADLDVVFGHLREFVSPDLDEPLRTRLRPHLELMPCPLEEAMLIRREAFDRVGPFTTGLRVGTGIDWYARMAELGLKSLMLSEVVVERRLHAQNNGIREREARRQYCEVLKASLDRRRQSGRVPPGVTRTS